MNHIAKSLVGASFAAILVGPALAQNWDMPTPDPDANFHTVNVRQFAEDVSAATNGALTITVHSNGSLIRHPEIRRTVRAGTVPIGEVLISLAANENPLYGLDSVPFLATSYEEAFALYQAQKPALEEALAGEGLTLLFSVPWPPQGIYAKNEITRIEDLQGLRFRTYNPGTGRIAEISGATPVQVEVADLPTAFATGRVEATITSTSTGVNSTFWDFVDYYHDTQAWLPRNMVFVNTAAFERLDEATRTAIREAAAAAEERGWQLSQEDNAKSRAILEENGLNVIEPSEELREGFAAIGEQIAGEWAEQMGPTGTEILERFRAR